jgi:dTDP-4-dehydrorhamnose reductase
MMSPGAGNNPARTDVDGCERERIKRINQYDGTQHVALACQRASVPLVYISTLSVFDGAKCEPYTEFDTPNPQSWYSRSKYEGEKIVERLLRCYYIVRAGWMFGGGREDKKFVAKIIELASNRPELKIVNDKFGSPTYTRDLARALIQLTRAGWSGVYHAANTGGPCSRYEFAQKVLEYAQVTSCRLLPVTSASFTGPVHGWRRYLHSVNWGSGDAATASVLLTTFHLYFGAGGIRHDTPISRKDDAKSPASLLECADSLPICPAGGERGTEATAAVVAGHDIGLPVAL